MNQKLTVTAKGGLFTISIGIDNLADLLDKDTDSEYAVKDKQKFAEAVVNVTTEPDYDDNEGHSPVEWLLLDAIQDIVECDASEGKLVKEKYPDER